MAQPRDERHLTTDRHRRPLVAQIDAELSELRAGDTLLVAVSGGPDSVALLLLCHEALTPRGVHLRVAHLDHAMRADSNEDRRFVAELAARLRLPCDSERIEIDPDAVRRHGPEGAARIVRHEFFERVADRSGAVAVALGHTLDDRAESLLFNLISGGGGGGLGGMPERRGRLRRPLLHTRRAALRTFLDDAGEAYRDDPSNLDPRLMRGRLRGDIVPALTRLNPRAMEAIGRTAQRLAADDAYLDALAGPASFPLDARRLATAPEPSARRRALTALRSVVTELRELGHEHVDTVLALARGQTGALATDLPGGGRLVRVGGWVTVEGGVTPPGVVERGEIGDILLSESDIQRRVAELGQEISQAYRGDSLVAVGVLKGGLFFLTDLLRHIESPVSYEPVRAESYGASTRSNAAPRMTLEPPATLAGRHVLVVEDIVDTGRTLNLLLARITALKPASLRIVSLLDKPSRRAIPIELDWVGFEIPDRFVVGYGLDYDDRHRNLPYVAEFRPEGE